MPAPPISFDPPYDLHLLRGQSLQIFTGAFSLLTIAGSPAHRYVDRNAGISYTFWTSFDEDKAADFGLTVDNPVEHDPAFDRKPNWRINLLANEPANEHNRIRNFHLFAEVTKEKEGDETEDPTNWTAVRIHIHNALSTIWLTPRALTIPLNVPYEFRVYARFDDDVVADISDYNYYRIVNPVAITWDSPTPNLINPNNGTIRAKSPAGLHDVTVSAVYNGTTLQDSVLAHATTQLTDTSTLRAELVVTGGCPGFSRLNDVPNILFLSEGFTRDQEFNFKILVAEYVLDLMNKKITSPFNLLKGSINFWMVFVPSRESGATYCGDLAVRQKPNEPILAKLIGLPIPHIEKPDSDKPIAQWGVEHLLYWVGLPVRAERNPDDQQVIDGIFAKWAATTNLTDDEIDKLKTNESLRKKWQKLGERRLPDAKDTAFGITITDQTAALRWGDFSEINLDSKRIQRRHLDALFRNLRDEDDNLIGTTFIKEATLTQPQGKDWDNIVLLTAIRRGRALNSAGYMFTILDKVSYFQTTETLLGDLTTFQVPIAPTDLPNKLPINAKATTTHELCHSFGLEDEYGEQPPSDSYDNKPVTDPSVSGWPFANFTERASNLDWSSNTQARADLEVPVSTGGHQIQPYHIKWRYHRIQTCGIVTALTVTGNQVILILPSGQVSQFTVNKSVFLRKRRKTATVNILFNPVNGSTSTLATIVTPDPMPIAFGREVEITAIDVATNQVTLTSDGDTLIVQVEPGQAASLQTGTGFEIRSGNRRGPVVTLFRTPNPADADHDLIEKALSPLLTVTSIDAVNNQITLTIPANSSLSAYLSTVDPNEAMIVFEPIDMPDGQRSADYPHAELISQKVLNHILVNPFAFNTNDAHQEVIPETSDNTNIPGHLVPCCSRRKKEVIGLYAGGDQRHGGVYHPAASCMMRSSISDGHYTELCAVCRYTLVNLIDPTKHRDFDADYMDRNIYPD
ncbi:hypothetical protein GCM10028805_15920 [Spirosoma harenae]